MLSSRNRPLWVAAGVTLFHLGAVWALQSGLVGRAVQAVVPVEILSEFIEPPKPKVEPSPTPPPRPVQVVLHKAAPPPPMPLAIADPAPPNDAPTGVLAPPVPTPVPPMAAQVATAATPAPAPPAPQIELPSSDADYLHNPRPHYPAQSRRLGEQGKVVVRVFIGVDGLAHQAEIRTSSGFERLDDAALNTVKAWRYVPGKRAGVVQAMWFSVPINYVLE